MKAASFVIAILLSACGPAGIWNGVLAPIPCTKDSDCNNSAFYCDTKICQVRKCNTDMAAPDMQCKVDGGNR